MIKMSVKIDELDLDLEISLNDDTESKYSEFYNQKLIDRIKNHYSQTSNYSKKPCHRINKETNKLDIWETSNPTGNMLRLNEIKYLAIIDIDINHKKNNSMDENEAEITRNQIIDKCKSNNYVLGQTPSGGFHIYCNCDDEWIEFAKKLSNSNDVCRITGIKIKTGLDLDIFTSMEEYENGILKVNNVLMIGSKIIYENDPGIKESKFINGSYNSIVNYSVVDVLKAFEWFSFVENHRKKEISCIKSKKNIDSILQNNSNIQYKYEHFDLPEETQIALINGLSNIEVHNSTHSGNKLEDELTLMILFQAINELNENLIEKAYFQVFSQCKLTDNAKLNFNIIRNQNLSKKQDFKTLIKIVKVWNPEYYKNQILPLIGGIQVHKFDLNDKFRIADLCEKASHHKYNRLDLAANDISRIYRYHQEGDKYFIEKGYDIKTKMLKFNYVRYEKVKEELKTIKLYPKTENSFYTAWDAFLEYKHYFAFNEVLFNSDDKDVISVFHGFKYQELDECNMNEIKDYLKLIYEVISDSNEEVYNYILNWISYFIQNPGKRNMTSIILRGSQGCGKNTFTDIISELLTGYSCSNLTRIEDITGQFNKIIENKMFMVLNEMRTAKDKYIQEMDSLKSIITDPEVVIGEKFEPRRSIENVSNLIFISNHAKPLIIPPNDRRFIVCDCNGKYRNSEFLENLHDLPESFYNNLFTYFMRRNLSNYNPRKIPMTQAKKNIIEACRSDVDNFIVKYYNEIVEGITASETKILYDRFKNECEIANENYQKWTNFRNDLLMKCVDGKQIRILRDQKRIWVYKLKDEYLEIYKPEINQELDDDYIDDISPEIMYKF